MTDADFDIFLMAPPGLEAALAAEAKALGFKDVRAGKGGVTVRGGWPDVWRANLEVRGAGRVVASIGAFRAFHLAQLDKRARKVAWASVLRPDVPFQVEATCRSSKIYHSGAAAQRIEKAIKETIGARSAKDAPIVVRARIEDDLCSIGIDTSGEPLHKRGYKEAVAKAPMRETMAALLLRQCGYDGSEPVLDPMCGSGTFVIEAAEIASGLKPGRARHFAFEQLATFDKTAWERMRNGGETKTPQTKFYGCDRDAGAIEMGKANAERAGVPALCEFRQQTVSELSPPEGPPGLVIVNPPYGTRIGEKKSMAPLYRALGQALLQRFGGWRVGIITSEAALAKATGLPFGPPSAPIAHGGLKVFLFKTGTLGASGHAAAGPSSSTTT